jgi:type I restriction enzyme S subunit
MESGFRGVLEAWVDAVADALEDDEAAGPAFDPFAHKLVLATMGVPVLRSANLRETGIELTDLVYISKESNALLSKSTLRHNDLVAVRTGYPGTTCVVPKHLDGINCVDLVISRPGPKIDPRFLALWINSPFGKDQVLRMQGGLALVPVGAKRRGAHAPPRVPERALALRWLRWPEDIPLHPGV